MSRTKATDISQKIRQEVLERDKHCISCGKHSTLTIAHVWINRSHGGLGVKENLCVLCMDCHHAYDNGKSHEQDYQRAVVQRYMLGLYDKPDLNKLKYNKYNDIF